MVLSPWACSWRMDVALSLQCLFPTVGDVQSKLAPCHGSAPSPAPRESSASLPAQSISTHASPFLRDTSISPTPLIHRPWSSPTQHNYGQERPKLWLIPRLSSAAKLCLPHTSYPSWSPPSPTLSSSLAPQQEGVSRGVRVNDQHQVAWCHGAAIQKSPCTREQQRNSVLCLHLLFV